MIMNLSPFASAGTAVQCNNRLAVSARRNGKSAMLWSSGTPVESNVHLPHGLGRKALVPRTTRRSRAAAVPVLCALATQLKTLKKVPVVEKSLTWERDLNTHYELGATLGEGQQGIVKEATCKKSGKTVAVKVMTKSGQARNNAAAVKRMKAEATFLAESQTCPFAVRLVGAYEDDENLYVVMDCLSGGSLAENLEKVGKLTEKQTAQFMHHIFSFLAHTHARGVCYGDIKPANFMLTSQVESGAPCVVKAVDFGCCQKVVPGLRFRVKTGTPLYMAPEVHVCNYGVESDVWSAAVMMFQMLSGNIPFVQCDRRGHVRDMGVHLGFSFDGEEWQGISAEAKDLITKLLVRDKTKRLSAKEVLNHPWFSSFRTGYSSNIISLKTGGQDARFAAVA